MKKLLTLLIVFILATGFVFAQLEGEEEEVEEARERAIEFFNMEIGMAFPVHWTSGMHDQDVHPHISTDEALDRTVTANIALNFAMNFNFTRHFGFTLDADVFYGTKLVGFSDSSSDNIALFGVNAFFGPQFYLFNNDLLRVPLAIGAHVYYYVDEVWNPNLGPNGEWFTRKDLQFGPAIMLAVQFHFSRNIYIYSKTFVSIDFIRYHEMTLSDGWVVGEYPHEPDNGLGNFSLDEFAWTVRPSIGVGIKY